MVLLRKHIKEKIHVSDLSEYAIILGISYKEGLKCQKKEDPAPRDQQELHGGTNPSAEKTD